MFNTLNADFFHLTSEQFISLDLTLYSPEVLKEMAHFIWVTYVDDASLMAWREEKLIPLIQIDHMDGDED